MNTIPFVSSLSHDEVVNLLFQWKEQWQRRSRSVVSWKLRRVDIENTKTSFLSLRCTRVHHCVSSSQVVRRLEFPVKFSSRELPYNLIEYSVISDTGMRTQSRRLKRSRKYCLVQRSHLVTLLLTVCVSFVTRTVRRGGKNWCCWEREEMFSL